MTRSASVTRAALRPAVSPSALSHLHVARPRWLTTYTAVLVVLDGTAMAAATLTAKISWIGIDPEPLLVRSFSIPYTALTLATVPTWLVLLALAGAYDLGPFASDTDDWTRVIRAGAQLLAVIAVSYYIVHLALLGRGVLAGTVPLAVILTIGGRTLAQLGLGELRRRGRARRTALVIGSQGSVDGFMRHVESRPTAGVTVVGTSIIGDDVAGAEGSNPPTRATAPPDVAHHDRRGPGTNDSDRNGSGANGSGTSSSGTIGSGTNGSGAGDTGANDADPEPDAAAGYAARATGADVAGVQPHPLVVSDALARTGAETLIVTGGLAQGQLRDIAWMLQGTGIELMVIPTPGDIEGLRTEIRPVAGLPLLYLDR